MNRVAGDRLVSAAAKSLLLAVVLLVCLFGWAAYHAAVEWRDSHFDPVRWRADQQSREQMVDELLRLERAFDGNSREQVEKTLGRPRSCDELTDEIHCFYPVGFGGMYVIYDRSGKFLRFDPYAVHD